MREVERVVLELQKESFLEALANVLVQKEK